MSATPTEATCANGHRWNHPGNACASALGSLTFNWALAESKCSCYVHFGFSGYQMWAFRQTDEGVRKVSALCGGPVQLALDLRLPQQSPVHAPAHSQPSTLFFAVLPIPVVAERIAARAERLRHQHGLRAKRRPTELLHVTLNAVGSFSGLPADVLAAAIYAGTSVRMAAFNVTLDNALSFRTKPPLPFVLRSGHGTAELTTLRNAIGAAMRHVGLRAGNHSNFTPHVTMLYDWQSVPEEEINEPITWTAREFVLVHSQVGKSLHLHRARWPLRG